MSHSSRKSGNEARRLGCGLLKHFVLNRMPRHLPQPRLADSSNVAAGTLNPHEPKRMIAAAQLLDWLDE
jgi:hypothetical protein